MTNLIGLPNMCFNVGRVQVGLWNKEVDDGTYWVSVARKQGEEPHLSCDYDLINSTEITSAILALKQAHEFLNQAEPLKWDENQPVANINIPERVP